MPVGPDIKSVTRLRSELFPTEDQLPGLCPEPGRTQESLSCVLYLARDVVIIFIFLCL